MLDDILIIGKSGGGKAKVGLLGLEFGGWLGGNLSGVGIQVVGSSWAKIMIILRLKSGGMGLFYNLFVCIIILWMMCHYMLFGTLWYIWSRIWVICYC